MVNWISPWTIIEWYFVQFESYIYLKITMFSNITMKKRVFCNSFLELQKTLANSLYLYVMTSNKQVAWIAKLQLTIYMVQLIVFICHELQSCNTIYIWCNSLQLNCNSVKTTNFQLLFSSIIITPMMLCWHH